MIPLVDLITIRNKRIWKGDGIYVGRPHILGNPYTHLKNSTKAQFIVGTREEAIANYREWLTLQLSSPATRKAYMLHFDIMVDKIIKNGSLNLICWCAPLPCHANIVAQHVLRRLQERYTYDEQTGIFTPK